MARPLATQNPLYRTDVENGRTLIGYDWDNTTPGQPRLYLHWQTADGHIVETRDGSSLDNLPTYLGPWGIPRNDWSRLEQNTETTYVPLGQNIIWTGRSISNLQSLAPSPQPPASSLPQTFLASTPILRDTIISALRPFRVAHAAVNQAIRDTLEAQRIEEQARKLQHTEPVQ